MMNPQEQKDFSEAKFKGKQGIRPTDLDTFINGMADDALTRTGWISYNDTQYTEASPFMISNGVKVTLANNGLGGISTQKPYGADQLYNASTLRITPMADGDYYVTTIRFKAKNTASTNASFDFGVDIGGTQGEIFKETKIFNKGAGIEHDYSIIVPMFTGATFLANGGQIKIKSNAGNISIYNIAYQIVRLHKAR